MEKYFNQYKYLSGSLIQFDAVNNLMVLNLSSKMNHL